MIQSVRRESLPTLLISGLAFVALGCAAAGGATTHVSPDQPTVQTVFTDSSTYRLQCQEADTIRVLKPIPRSCTPRDQRVLIPIP